MRCVRVWFAVCPGACSSSSSAADYTPPPQLVEGLLSFLARAAVMLAAEAKDAEALSFEGAFSAVDAGDASTAATAADAAAICHGRSADRWPSAAAVAA